MRLRLDKLVLSAGLALAMVATTIPAIAGTTPPSTTQQSGWAYNGVHFEFNDGKAALAKAVNSDYVEKTDEATTANGFKTFSSTVAVADGGETAVGMGETLAKEVEAAGQESENQNFLKGALTITYTVNYTSGVIAGTTGLTASATLTDTEVTAINAAITAKKAAIEELKKSVTAFESTKAGVSPSVTAGEVTVVGGMDVTALTTVDTNTTQNDAEAIIAELGKSYSLKQTVTTVEKVTDLPDGYTYDVLLTKNAADADNYEYHIWSQDSSVSTSYKNQADAAEIQDLGKDGLMVSLKTLSDNVTYFLTASVVSTTKNLIHEEPTVDGLNIVVTPNAETNDDKTAKEFIDKYVTENDLNHIAYLNIAVTKTADGSDVTETETALTFKIAVPTDLPALEDGKTRVFKVIRVHGGEVVELPTEVVDGYIVFSSNLFSDYALAYVDVAADTTEDQTNNETESATEAGTETTTAGSSTTSTTTSTKTADNSMMPLFMTTLLLALCAGSLAIYKEKKTN